ncbi:hypothetical protein [Phytohabitans suffuscus]|uniref:Uncharacterized protein n=1 Tax=Phytohabitans suffuscus TaxID=624315 RepID=A0A6F8YV38_9ACTN|nr:hypothetical protein [Phytohabitans suffuscus]BCB89939.1 hypothetical protein Psuf_072520 [Phytohabitans suffuscus]
MLWARLEAARDVGAVEARAADDLRYRMELDLRDLLGQHPFGGPVSGVPGHVADRLDGIGQGFPVVTDPRRARRALEDAASRLPRPSPALGPDDPPPTDRLDRYFHLDGQSLAPWLAAATRLVEALAAAGRPLGDLPERLAAYRDANAAGPWWPGHRLVIVAERPASVDSTPGGLTLRWADGTELPPPRSSS